MRVIQADAELYFCLNCFWVIIGQTANVLNSRSGNLAGGGFVVVRSIE